MSLVGKWLNEFGSILEITLAQNGILSGIYSSHTGATGLYEVVGVYDTSPDPSMSSQAVSFSVSWRDDNAPFDPSFHWVSAFSGQLQIINGVSTISTTYLLQKNSESVNNWGATVVATATFRPYYPQSQLIPSEEDMDITSTRYVPISLQRGPTTGNGASPWYSTAELGTPSQSLKFMIDTGTNHTWVTSSLCTTTACNLHNKFLPDSSSTYSLVSDKCPPFSFGPWGTMDVVLGKDLYSFPYSVGSIAQSMSFYLATNYSGSQFEGLDADGGLAISSVPASDVSSSEILPLLKREGVIDYAIASFFTGSPCGGECLLGAIDTRKYSGSLNVVQLQRYQPIPYLWTVNLNTLSCLQNIILRSVCFALDTGSSRFKGDANYINAIIGAVTLNYALPTTLPLDDPDFSQYPSINLNINGVNYCLAPEQYFIPNGNHQWELAFHVLDGLDGLLLVGSVFLDTVYTVFYYETAVEGAQAIGLGKLTPKTDH